jgi:(p)ppGpp synthase/HD superfamily hydrolase
MNDLVDQAIRFATQIHRRIDQRRKYNFQPFEVHLKAVASTVAGCTDDPEMIAAAWLHDTVEDTPATLDDIEREFGHDVRVLVAARPRASGPRVGAGQDDQARRPDRQLRRHLQARPTLRPDLPDRDGGAARRPRRG